MKFDELIVLLPCHSLEDFPTYQEGEEAEGLLAAWTALWHPALLASAGSLPTWYRADGPPAELAGRLVIVPSASERLLLAGWNARAADAGAYVVRKCTSRAEILRAALSQLDGADAYLPPVGLAAAPWTDGDSGPRSAGRPASTLLDLAGDFLALGYSYLMVELLTRQMRYMSNLDEVRLRNETLAAARDFVEGRDDSCRNHLQACFQVLLEARERFYPVDAYLVDLTLVAGTTLGERLRDELSQATPLNLLLAAEHLEEMECREPQSLESLRRAIDAGRVTLVGGEYKEGPLALAPCEGMLAGLRRGLAVYERLLGRRPVIYGRRRHGLNPLLPQILSRLGFTGALHFTLDEGHFPHAGQSKIRWQGLDASAIDAILRVPADASRVETFLSLARKMGETMDRDHVAVLLLAHWPGQSSPYLGDLRRMARYAPVLGRFVTLEAFFTRTDRPGELVRFRADQYRAPYLQQAMVREERDAVSRLAAWHQQALQAQTVQTLHTLAALLGGESPESPCAEPAALHAADRVGGEQGAQEEQQAAAELSTAAKALARLIAACSTAPAGWLVLNPASFSAACGVELPAGSQVEEGGPVLAVQSSAESTRVAVEVPALGFAWLGRGSSSSRPAKKRARAMAEGRIVRNDLLEIEVHPETGGIRALHDFAFRGNRLSQQLALRLPGPRPRPGEPWRDPDANAFYSHMVADAIECTSTGPVLGEITSRGRLLDDEGACHAAFVQKVQLWRGVPYAVLDIELDPRQEPRADPWNSYFAARFAWAEEEAELYGSIGLASQPTGARRIEAPAYIEIRGPRAGCTILTGGLPYHRRIGSRMLDSLLIVRGESQRRFRLGVAADLKHPAQQALHLLQAFPVVAGIPRPASGDTGWLFHLDARNVVATSWAPLVETSRVVGFRARLMEVEGRAGRVQLRSLRRPTAARQVDFLGAPLIDLAVQDDRVVLDLGAYEWVGVEARWAT